LFLGCTGKSAQIPLHTWLPDAMAGPTPVSALIHAATMVTAGVYLCVRMNFLFALAPTTMGIIAITGAVTALFAATIGITQNDIKKVLAWSTVSQLGFMFIAVGMGAWVAAIFHLVTHAFFKACLFLGSGSVIEACHHEQDIRRMGGLRKKMPVTAWTFGISVLAIAGIPPLAGFFSKDEILLHAYTGASLWSPGLNYAVFALGIVAAACTAFYMARVYLLTFEGKYRGDMHTWDHYVKEYPIMTGPLVILAIGAAFAGFLGYPHALPFHESLPHLFAGWLEPIYDLSARYTGDFYVGYWHQPDGSPAFFMDAEGHGIKASTELMFMGISVTVAALGLGFAWTLYKDGPSKEAEAWAKRLGILYSASKAKYWIDEIYGLVVGFVRLLAGGCYQVIDQLVIDGLGVGGVSGTVGFFGNLVRIWHNGNVRRYMLWLVVGVGIVLGAVYLNPTVSKFGPTSELNSADLGGLRPTLGERPIKLKILGLWEVQLGPDTGPPPAAVRPGPEKVEREDADPRPARGEAKGGTP
jgi:NADH-quinone oxidoreductase subunit L